jgi:exopolysaccharide production protein ExoY
MKTESLTLWPAFSPARQALNLLGCLLALPLLCLMAFVMSVVTSLVSPGPVIYRQKRIGYRGREFMAYKFRTTYLATEIAARRHQLKEPVDSLPAVKPGAPLLPCGWLLRASGLDELPQIINVIRGEMSLVGPRPCPPTEFAPYFPEHRERTLARPGLTGLWRVSGKNVLTFEEMIQLDIHYTRHASLLLDLKIIFLTLIALPAQIKDLRRQDSAPPLQASRSILRSVVTPDSRMSKSA